MTTNTTVSEADATTGTSGTGAFQFDMDIYANDRFNALADDSQVYKISKINFYESYLKI